MSNYNTSARPVEIELIRSMARRPLSAKQNNQLDELLRSPADSSDAFIMKPAADWLQTTNDRHDDATATLFGDFWYQGELCIMFADTNVGKSILAVQIGDSLSRGEAIPGFAPAGKPEKVLYFDFELSAAQFRKRYSSDNYGNYNFAPVLPVWFLTPTLPAHTNLPAMPITSTMPSKMYWLPAVPAF